MNVLFFSGLVALVLSSACGGSSDRSESHHKKSGQQISSNISLSGPATAYPKVGEVLRFKHNEPNAVERSHIISLKYPENMICWAVKTGFECVVTNYKEAIVTAFIRDPANKEEEKIKDFVFND